MLERPEINEEDKEKAWRKARIIFQGELIMRILGPEAGPSDYNKWVLDNAGKLSLIIDGEENQNIRDLVLSGEKSDREKAIGMTLDLWSGKEVMEQRQVAA